MSEAKAAFVLAAGKGERLRPLTEDRPKPLVELAGKTILEHILDRLEALELERVVLNAWYHGDQIESFAKSKQNHYSFEILVSREEELLGTGGGLRQALPLIGETPFWMLNGDIYFDGDLSKLRPSREVESHWLMTSLHPEQTPVGLREERLVSIGELWGDLDKASEKACFAGIQWIQHLEVAELPVKGCLIRDYFLSRLKKGVAIGADTECLKIWEDLGTPERLQQLETKILKKP